MAVQEIIDLVLNPVFGWLLNLPPILAILILSVVLGLVSILAQKYMTDQAKMRRLKSDTKKLQKQMKEAQKAKEQDKMMKVQQKLMPIQLDMMKETFKPLLLTMVPFLIIFLWLGNHFAFLPIEPGEQFTVTAEFEEGLSGQAALASETLDIGNGTKQIEGGVVAWTASGPAGKHDLTLSFAGAEVTRQVLITENREYVPPQKVLDGPVREFNVNNAKLLPLGQGFNLFGWRPGWIFYYIIFSIPISLGIKKLLNVA